MALLKHKLKKLKPVIKAKKFAVDEQSKILMEIRHQKLLAQGELQKYQKLYIEGIDNLNQERQSPDRSKLDVLEGSIDYAKFKWYESLKIIKEIEVSERNQVQILNNAQKELHVFEKLNDKYIGLIQKEEAIKEQKMLDEFAIKAFAMKE